jgi:glycosyltransferase involved in cell wall biosynthesis
VRPTWFSYEKCYRSVKNANIDLYILIDGTIKNHHFQFDIEDRIQEFNGGDDASSLLYCLNYIEKQQFDDDDIIYIVEDDYYHRPNWDSILLEAFDTFDVDYVTLYDHEDKYTFEVYDNLQSKILHSANVHWRTTPSTCNTYAAKWKTLKKHWNEFHIKYCLPEFTHGGYDHTKFVQLWSAGSNLISCIPGYSTHSEIPFISPIVEWDKI